MIVVRIALRHYEGHILIHTESRRVVDHHSTILRNGLCKLLGGSCTCRGEGDINILKVIVMLKQFHLNLLTFERVLTAGTTL